MVFRPLDGEVGIRTQPEDDLPVVRLGPAVARDVEIAAPGREPRVPAQEGPGRGGGARFAVLGATDPGLPEVVPARPREVTDHVRMLPDRHPRRADGARMGLAADDHPVGIQRTVSGEPRLHVVVARHVQIGGGLGRVLGDDRRVHELVQPIGNVGHRGVHARLLARAFARLFGCVRATPGELGEELGSAHQQPADGLGDEPGGVERPDLLRHRTPDASSHRRPRLGDLVADAVHDHARVVEVLPDHRLHVRLPPVGEPQRVVVLALRLGPHVEGLVHDEHPEAIACVEHRLAEGVVGTSDGVEPGLLEQLDAAFLGAVDGGRPERAVVVVHTGTTKQDRLPVDPQSPRRVDGERPDAEGRRLLVQHHLAVAQGRPAGVEGRVVRAPAPWLRQPEPLPGRQGIAGHRRDGRFGAGGHDAVRAEQLDAEHRVRRGNRLVPHHCADRHHRHVVVDLGCDHLQATGRQVDAPPLEPPDVAVDAAARIPPAVVVGTRVDLDLVGLAEAQQVVDLHGEVRIAAGTMGDQRVVHPYPRVAVDAVELQDDRASRVLGRRLERLAVLPGPAREVRRRPVTRWRPRSADHGVVGQRHRCRLRARARDQFRERVDLGADRPAVVEGGPAHGPASYASRDVIATMTGWAWAGPHRRQAVSAGDTVLR